MKEIKFRGRDIENNKIIFSKSIEFEKIGDLNGYQPYLRNDNGDWVRCYPESIVQLIGYDKNGAEVYEGDALETVRGMTIYAAICCHAKIAPAEDGSFTKMAKNNGWKVKESGKDDC